MRTLISYINNISLDKQIDKLCICGIYITIYKNCLFVIHRLSCIKMYQDCECCNITIFGSDDIREVGKTICNIRMMPYIEYINGEKGYRFIISNVIMVNNGNILCKKYMPLHTRY